MNNLRTFTACLFALVYFTLLLGHFTPVQAVTLAISTDHPIYPIWGVGGQVRVTAQNLMPNTTYYLWLQEPKQSVSNFTGLSFPAVAGGLPAVVVLKISSHDLPGTYLLSLSRSGTTDTREALVHFGIVGTNSQAYQRTETVTVMGGGFAANSTITLAINSTKGEFAGFPVNLTAHADGNFEYSFRLSPSAETGNFSVALKGTTYDTHQAETAKTVFRVTSSTVSVKVLRSPVTQVERTLQVSTSYLLAYTDGSPVTVGNATASVIMNGQRLYSLPLVLVNPSSGEWNATWKPPPSTAVATYYFQFDPANFTDAYGNNGQGPTLSSGPFEVVPARFQTTVQTSSILQRTQDLTLIISITYPDGSSATNVTQARVAITRSDGTRARVNATISGRQAAASFKIPVNAVLGNWTGNYTVKDVWGNLGSGNFTFRVEPANLTFQAQVPNATERTTFLNLTNTVLYPDGTPLNSSVTLQIWGGNQTWLPSVKFDPSNGEWSASFYLVQNATLGQYNLTWAARDPYGNARSSNYTAFVDPARFSFVVEEKNSTIPAMTDLDLPLLIRYPNGSSLMNTVGNATGSYRNSTGYVFIIPLAYNATNGTWHMIFFVPEQANATLSFTANDQFGNSAVAMDAYNLKISNVPKVVTQNLIIAGVIGALIPIALLAWAFATISTRRRKHKP